MPKILYCPDIKDCLRLSAKDKQPDAFIILEPYPISAGYCRILEQKGIKKIEMKELSDGERLLCEKEYINNIADIGLRHHSPEWWANSASQKNEYISANYRNLCIYYSLIKMLSKYIGSGLTILVIGSDEIFGQLRSYCASNNIEISSFRNRWSKKIYEKCLNILKIAYYIIRILIRKLYAHHILKNRTVFNPEDNYYIIRTWLDKRFLKMNEGYLHSAYFGKLPEYATGYGYKLLLLAGIDNNYREILHKIKTVKEILIIPEEYFLKYADCFRLLKYLRKRIKLKKKVLFRGIDVTEIYKAEISKGEFNAGYLNNVLMYFIGKRIARALKFKVYIQTFENYAWEKMAILGIREAGSNGKIFGFQHAYIGRNSFKYFQGEAEDGIMPLPDRIITMGKVTKRIMERYGSYNSDILKAGCALRQDYIDRESILGKRRFNKVVVPLNMVKNEAASIIKFLYKSELPHSNIKVIIRCHPEMPFEAFESYIDFRLPDNFVITNERNLREELSDSDMVIYTWTTVAVEALKLGLPVIYLDILYPMYVDPLFECNALHSVVRRPDELMPRMEDFYNMEDSLFYKKQQVAQGYLKEYFYPVNEENLAPFFN